MLRTFVHFLTCTNIGILKTDNVERHFSNKKNLQKLVGGKRLIKAIIIKSPQTIKVSYFDKWKLYFHSSFQYLCITFTYVWIIRSTNSYLFFCKLISIYNELTTLSITRVKSELLSTRKLQQQLQKNSQKYSFPSRSSSLNVTKSAASFTWKQ